MPARKGQPAPQLPIHIAPSSDDHHAVVFCLLDYEAEGQDKPLLVVIDGRDKPFRTELTHADHAAVRALGDEYWKHNPRSLA